MTTPETIPPLAPDLSVVILCYRTGRDVEPIVRRLHAVLSLLTIRWEIILVGNYHEGAPDETPQVVRELARVLPGVRAVTRPKEGMMGWDLRCGLEACRGDVLALIDGDGQFPIEMIVACYLQLTGNPEIDFVQTYRISREDGFVRHLLSFGYNRFVGLLFPGLGIPDVNSKPKLIRRALYERLHLEDDGWFLDAEMVLKSHLLGARFLLEPIRFYRLRGRPSFVKFAAIWEFIVKLIRFRRSRRALLRRLAAPRP